MADNGVIGRDGALPWHLPDDLRHFKAVTLGKPILMGWRTLESIGKALPGRRNLVLTHRTAGLPDGVEIVSSIEAARRLVSEAAELCVIGGSTVYAQALPLASRLYLTRVHAAVAGDVRFDWDERDWREIERCEHPADARHAYGMSFVTLERPPIDPG